MKKRVYEIKKGDGIATSGKVGTVVGIYGTPDGKKVELDVSYDHGRYVLPCVLPKWASIDVVPPPSFDNC